MFQEWRGQTFVDVLDYAGRTWPEGVAVSDGDRSWTYAALRARVREVACGLAALGVRHGDHVAYLMGVGIGWVETYFAALRLGAVLVPLNLVWEPRELAHALRATKSNFVIAGERHRGVALLDRITSALHMMFDDTAGADHVMPTVISFEGSGNDNGVQSLSVAVERADGELDGCHPFPGPEECALLLMTSGSTSFPKPAIHSHQSMLAGIASYADGLEIGAGDAFLHTTPNYHVGGIITMVAPLLRGARVRLMNWFDPAEAMRWIAEDKITLLWGFDTHFAMMRQDESYGRYDLSSVTRTMVAANPGSFDAIRDMGFGHVGSLYGSTEYMGSQSFFPYRDRFDTVRMKQSHGRPMSAEIRIVDPKSGNECSAGIAGEICVRGPALFGGYFGMPDETARCMDDEGFFHSGDIGWVDEDGYVYYQGRFKEMIKTGGENVSALEIEAFLTAAVPAIRRVIVCGTPHDKWGEAVTALIESEPEAELGERDVIDACRGQLAGYKIPKRITFVDPSDWVITPTGKLDRRIAQRIALDRFAAIDNSN